MKSVNIKWVLITLALMTSLCFSNVYAADGDLVVSGTADIAGGVLPDYDSGWVSENSTSNHNAVFTHSLGVIPSKIVLYFATTNSSPSTVYVVQPPYDTNGGPISIKMSTTAITLTMYSGAYMYKIWELGTWTNYNTGYYKVLAWK